MAVSDIFKSCDGSWYHLIFPAELVSLGDFDLIFGPTNLIPAECPRNLEVF